MYGIRKKLNINWVVFKWTLKNKLAGELEKLNINWVVFKFLSVTPTSEFFISWILTE